MILYEVNATLPATEAGRYSAFLDAHIPKLLAIPGFLRAEWWTRDPQDEKLTGPEPLALFTVHYHVESKAALDRYLQNEAAKMRAEAVDLFGDRLSTHRRILSRVKTLSR